MCLPVDFSEEDIILELRLPIVQVEALFVFDIGVEEEDAGLFAVLAIGNFEEKEPDLIILAASSQESLEVAADCSVEVWSVQWFEWF